MRDTFTNTEADAAAFEAALEAGIPDSGEACWHDADDAPLACIACGGDLTPLGSLGRLQWFRCRDCGMDQEQHEAETARDQDVDAMIHDCFAKYTDDAADDTPF